MKEAKLKEIINQWGREEITFSRMNEIINEHFKKEALYNSLSRTTCNSEHEYPEILKDIEKALDNPDRFINDIDSEKLIVWKPLVRITVEEFANLIGII